MVIIVATDQHLGYTDSKNAQAFSSFLTDVSKRSNVTDFVLLGDFVDMWRRDVSGLFFEFHDILEQVFELRTKMNVYCIAGNHDYHLLNLTDDSPLKSQYPFQFLPNLDLPANQPKYLFRHGWEFDPLQQKDLMEILCHNLSDNNGQIRSEIWDALTNKIKNDTIDEVKKIFDKFEHKDQYLAKILLPPEQRLGTGFGIVEERACNFPQPGQILIFGHTHRPFVNKTNNVANAGSWVSGLPITNTYVELDGNDIHLMQYDNVEIKDREDCPKGKLFDL